MKDEHIILVLDYLEGKLSDEQLSQLDELLQAGVIRQEEIEELRQFYLKSESYPAPEPSEQLRHNFFAQLDLEIAKENSRQKRWSWLPRLQTDIKLSQLVTTAFIFLLGLMIGLWFNTNRGYEQQMSDMRAELQNMQETMVINLLEQPSATQRLKAVSMSNRLAQTDEKVSLALLKVLNEDPHVNVRLAALDALLNYTQNPRVRQGLVLSIPGQDAPMVQIALAEAMVQLQEKKSVEALQQLMEQQDINEMVAEEIKKSIKALT
ncbi:HEAT repeat domain-containing protein [Catalinimonas niigatensis]|uniref:HEAT repeat domain-containing protein n=1 Tax=Catalinimonas niigatensis TaxID=1397264 RepID=UPI002666C854|nr:HEAT repeat domain-containing protein [Catalinimonas niigatensis]WPP49315.1 HEAT repeat domain-containing protein [Catalinimonas niigatensis]